MADYDEIPHVYKHPPLNFDLINSKIIFILRIYNEEDILVETIQK